MITNIGKLKLSKSKKFTLTRLVWYAFGFALFFAPLALAQKLLLMVFGAQGRPNIHGACSRMFVQDLFTGRMSGISEILSTSGIIFSSALLAAFFFGPVFCGKLCAAGAIPEYLSKLVPEKLKINWQKHINPAPVRYGMFAGFLLGPTLGVSVACSYCNFNLVEKMMSGIGVWDMGVLGSTAFITMFIWLGLLGAFTKGGRGYCTYMCPVGTAQNLMHLIGSGLKFTYKIKFAQSKCVSCSQCVKQCPTGALQMKEEGLSYNIHTCNTCHQCEKACPKAALVYGAGESGWSREKWGMVPEVQPERI